MVSFGTGRPADNQLESFVLTNVDILLISKRRAPEEVRGADSDSALAVEREAPQAPDAPSLCPCDDLPEAAASGGAGRGAGPCRVLLQLPDSFDLTNPETFPISARPASLAFSAPMTLPMSAGALAPVAEIASATAVAISASDTACGM